MFDFDPRDRDEDARDIEMPWVELRHDGGSDRKDVDPRDPDDARERDRDARERDVYPRDVFVESLELPRGLEREVVVDGDHRYEPNGECSSLCSDRVNSTRPSDIDSDSAQRRDTASA